MCYNKSMIIYYPSPFHVTHSPEVADRMCMEFDYEAIKMKVTDNKRPNNDGVGCGGGKAMDIKGL